MSMPSGYNSSSPLTLEFPQSLAVYDDYAAAQKAVDFLADNKFPVEHCLIVGTDLKRIERITGRLTTGRVALGGVLSGLWIGLFVGLIFALFTSEPLATLLGAVGIGVVFGVVAALTGYAMTRGQRDFSSVTQVVATKYEVLVEHKSAAQARELLAQLPGLGPTRSPDSGQPSAVGSEQKRYCASCDSLPWSMVVTAPSRSMPRAGSNGGGMTPRQNTTSSAGSGSPMGPNPTSWPKGCARSRGSGTAASPLVVSPGSSLSTPACGACAKLTRSESGQGNTRCESWTRPSSCPKT